MNLALAKTMLKAGALAVSDTSKILPVLVVYSDDQAVLNELPEVVEKLLDVLDGQRLVVCVAALCAALAVMIGTPMEKGAEPASAEVFEH